MFIKECDQKVHMNAELEKLVETKVKPLLTEAIHQNLGIAIRELESDISDRLKKTSLHFPIDTRVKFKEAKRRFKQLYIQNLLKQNLGNIEQVAKIASVDRRSVHRIVAKMKLDVQQLREQIDKKEYQQTAVQDIIKEALENFKHIIHPKRYQVMYKKAPQLSKDILKELPDVPEKLKVAEQEFEKAYLLQALKENNNNISRTAQKIGLRFETLHRKLRKLGLG